MIDELRPIPIKELERIGSPKAWNIEGYISEFPTLKPIKGKLIAKHQGDTLRINAVLSTVINLLCDRCLNEFSKELNFLGFTTLKG